jgi:hypothetical protein
MQPILTSSCIRPKDAIIRDTGSIILKGYWLSNVEIVLNLETFLCYKTYCQWNIMDSIKVWTCTAVIPVCTMHPSRLLPLAPVAPQPRASCASCSPRASCAPRASCSPHIIAARVSIAPIAPVAPHAAVAPSRQLPLAPVAPSHQLPLAPVAPSHQLHWVTSASQNHANLFMTLVIDTDKLHFDPSKHI